MGCNMKLITLQHKDVLNDIISNGRYECTMISNYHKESPKIYKILANRLGLSDGVYPIFTWAYLDNKPVSLNSETVTSANSKVPLKIKDYYAFELEVPDDKTDLQDFYAFAATKSDEYEFEIDPKAEMFTCDIGEVANIQCTIPEIRNEWIRAVYNMNEEKVLFDFKTVGVFNESFREKFNIPDVVKSERTQVELKEIQLF